MTPFLADAMAAIGDVGVWTSIAIALLAVPVLTVIGIPIAQRTNLLDTATDGDAATTFSVGLSVGLIVVAAVWATLASGLRSVYVPVAAWLLLAIALGSGRVSVRLKFDRRALRAGAAVAAFIVAISLLYATTIAPSPRDGEQPVGFFDAGFYSALGADLAGGGAESVYGPGAVDEMGASAPPQTWYHWGELWLAALVIDVAAISPMDARHLVVLPILVLAAVTLAGALVRRVVSPRSTEFFLIGAACMLFLAPIPLIRDPDIEWFARSLVFGVTQYGLAVVVMLLGMHLLISGRFQPTTSAALVGAGLSSALIASHVGLAVVAGVGVLSAAIVMTLADRHPTDLAREWLRPALILVASVLTTLAWGYATGHDLGGLGAMQGIGAFDGAWGRSLIGTLSGAGVVLIVPLVWLWAARGPDATRATVIGAVIATAAAAVVWGALVSDLNTFHLFFGAVLTILTPIAIVAGLSLLARARRERRVLASTLLLAAILGQATVGAVQAGVVLRALAPADGASTPVDVLAELRRLPDRSKVAYGCTPIENFAPWDYSLISIEAHSGVRLVPMCFMADRARRLLGRELDPSIESPFFAIAPQRSLYPNAAARPSNEAIEAFLRAHGISYIYTDATHTDPMVAAAEPLFRDGPVTVYHLPER